MAEEIQKKFQKQLELFQGVQKDIKKAVTQKQQLDSQLNENKAVKEELKLLRKDSEVYKLIGPVLVKQDLEEARQNVSKRMEYISKEIKRTDDHICALENKQEALQENLNKLRNDLGKLKLKA
ncbi:prefoldin subunit 6 [Bombyx mandarina]|uniref:Probable prefoldin subunit 6 n=2 Tax=Bombyx TaxID=7090 RepID=Q2F5Z8_BOMMO|nr:prefoldin beta subunit [Bombyx mori]XP_028026152.1 prefoldin subunit 6 [Bombyx mandarina]ABD36219.1 prefoldin beta subunit [Bombyx mori]